MLLDPTEVQKLVSHSTARAASSNFPRSPPEETPDIFIPIFKRSETRDLFHAYLSSFVQSARKNVNRYATSECITYFTILLLLLVFLFKFHHLFIFSSNSTRDITNYPGPKERETFFTEADSSLFDTIIDNSLLTSEFFVDTDGRRIHAHGGGMMQRNGLFFWYGTTAKEAPNWLSNGVNLYISSDLKTWKFQAQVFRNSSIEAPMKNRGMYRIERPKVIYNAKTSMYVMWFHLDTRAFSLRGVGIAQSRKAEGPFEFVKFLQPDEGPSLDMTLYQDEQNAYFIRSHNNKFAAISKLTDDYLGTTGICSNLTLMESPAIIKKSGKYFMFGSKLTGWKPNKGRLASSDEICGTWENLETFSSASNTTWRSQSTFVLPLKFGSKVVYMYQGDRWNFHRRGSVGNATYVWLPLIPKGDTFTMRWYDRWKIGDFTVDI